MLTTVGLYRIEIRYFLIQEIVLQVTSIENLISYYFQLMNAKKNLHNRRGIVKYLRPLTSIYRIDQKIGVEN